MSTAVTLKSGGRELEVLELEAKQKLLGFLALSAIVFGGVASLSAADSRQARPEAVLGGGKIGSSGWKVLAFGHQGASTQDPEDRRRPCLEVRITTPIKKGASAFQSMSGCYGPGYTTPTGEPLVAVVTELGSTAVGLAFDPAVTELKASFANGRQEAIKLHRLRPGPAKRIARERFRYAAFAVKGRWCPNHLVALDAAGQPLWERDEKGCLTSSGAAEFVEATT